VFLEENMDVGDRIKKRRKELHITQTQITETIGISSGNLSGIESGKNLPSATALLGLSEILHVSIDWILKGDSQILEIPFTEQENHLINIFRQLSDSEKEELVLIAEIKKAKATGKKIPHFEE